MSENTNLEEQIRDNAVQPKSAEVDGQKVEQHPLKDQIAVDSYLEGKKAMRRKNSGLKITKLQHSGA
jgi:hypothetical protein